jgi:hypothetical protein
MLPTIKQNYADLTKPETLEKYLEFLYEIIRVGYRWSYNKKRFKEDEIIYKKVIKQLLNECYGIFDYTVLYRLVFEKITRYFGKKRWLEKTPTHIFHIEKIVQKIPDAIFVEIVRDPRDILASKKTRKESVLTKGRYEKSMLPYKKLEKQYDTFWDSLSWKAAIKAGISAKHKYGNRITTIRYEDLVNRPDKIVSNMCEFLELDYREDLLYVKNRNKAEFDIDLHKDQRGILNDSIGRWTNVLKPEEVAVSQFITRHEAEIHGYEYCRVGTKYWHKAVPLLLTAFGDSFYRQIRKLRLYGPKHFYNFILNYIKRTLHLFGKTS